MSAHWWKSVGIFALAMIFVSFVSKEAAFMITLFVGIAAIVLRIQPTTVSGSGKGKVN